MKLPTAPAFSWPLLAALSLLLASIGLVLGTHVDSALKTAAVIARPHEVEAQLRQTRAALEAMQDAVQDYLIDGADGMREQYDQAVIVLKGKLDSLSASDRSDLSPEEFADLKSCVNRALSTSREVIDARHAGGPGAALALDETNLIAFNGAKQGIDLLIGRQREHLQASERALGWTLSVVGWVALSVLILLAIGLAVVAIEAEKRRQQTAQGKLRSENERLGQDIRERSATLARANEELAWFSKRAMQIQEHERQALALELHDQIGQELAALVLALKRCERAVPDEASEELAEAIGDGIEIARAAYGSVHDLALDLRPAMLDRLGLIPTLQWFAKQQARFTGCEIELDAGAFPLGLSADLPILAFRIVQEAVSNATRHGRARRIDIIVRSRENTIDLEIRDDGSGFDTAATEGRRDANSGLGLIGMRQRAKDAGGELTIESALGKGTVVRAVLPIRPVG